MTPEMYCKRCPIKEAGNCNPKTCRIVSGEDIAVQKALDDVSLELKLYLLKHEDSIFIKCGETVWVTMKDGELRDEAVKRRKALGIPNHIAIEQDQSMDYIQ